MSPELRLATAADASRVSSLLIDTRAKFMPYAPLAHPESQVREWVASHLIPTGGVIVAEVDGCVMAAMATETRKPFSWIKQMTVDPSLVGRGIGSLLLAHALHTLEPPIRLYAFQANVGARRFYERHGFTAIEFTDGRGNEERCPDVLYEMRSRRVAAAKLSIFN
jgi:GNAT superfamily N-acetyltransferase